LGLEQPIPGVVTKKYQCVLSIAPEAHTYDPIPEVFKQSHCRLSPLQTLRCFSCCFPTLGITLVLVFAQDVFISQVGAFAVSLPIRWVVMGEACTASNSGFGSLAATSVLGLCLVLFLVVETCTRLVCSHSETWSCSSFVNSFLAQAISNLILFNISFLFGSLLLLLLLRLLKHINPGLVTCPLVAITSVDHNHVTRHVVLIYHPHLPTTH